MSKKTIEIGYFNDLSERNRNIVIGVIETITRSNEHIYVAERFTDSRRQVKTVHAETTRRKAKRISKMLVADYPEVYDYITIY